jgi:hypothetical protein
MKNNAARTLIAETEQIKNELSQSINDILQNHNVPCYFLAPIFAEILAQVNNIAQSELFESQQYTQVLLQSKAMDDERNAKEQEQEKEKQEASHQPDPNIQESTPEIKEADRIERLR